MNPLARYLPIIEALVGLALFAGICFGVHQFLEHERDIGRAEVQARWDAQKVADELAADKQEKDWRAQVDSAINQGAKNAQALQAAANAATAASGGLRDTIATLRERLPSATAEASRAYAGTLATLLTKCEGEYRAMAKSADGHFNDAATLGAGWPTNAQKADTH